MEWVHHIVFVSITCILTSVLANSHQESNTPFVQVPLMLSGSYATSTVLRSLNETTLFITAFEQDFVLDVQKSRNFSVLKSTVETIYRAFDKPFRRKTTISDDCYFHGIIRNRRKSSVFLDACSKSICGILHDANFTYVIAQATRKNPVLHRFKRLTSAERPRHEKRQDPPEKFWRRWRRETRQVTLPSEGHLENSYMELYIVHDHQQFMDSERNLEALRNKSITLAHLLGKLFQDVNITISLVGSEVWNQGDEITISSDVYTTLDNFLSWKQQTLAPRQSHDFTLLISGTTFLHHMKAHTYYGEMCSETHSAAIVEDYTDDIVQIASDIAHSIGDNIGLRHDTPDCSCEDETGYCVMDVVKRKQPPTKFSSCSKGLLANHMRIGRLDCLKDLPTIPRGPLCGNGLLEEGEECDCGKPQECNDVCCLSSECVRRTDCSRRSSQILAAAEVVTAPLDLSETEERQASSLTFSKNYPQDSGPIVDEAVEERFNTIINADIAVAPDDPPHTTEPTKTTSHRGTTIMADDKEEVGDLDNRMVPTRDALTEEDVIMNIKGDEHQGTGLVGANNETTSDSSTNSKSSTSDLFSTPKSVDTAALCNGTSMSDGSEYILGESASVSEIMTELGESELPHPPTFIIEPQPDLYIVRAIDLELHCQASGNSVIGYTWLKDGEEIDIQSDPRMIIDGGNLTIQFPDSGDIGIYQCLVSNIYTTIVSSKSSVKRASMGRFSPGPGTIREVIVGTSVILACNPPLSVPTPLVMWALNHSAQPIHYNRRVSQDPKGNLVIASVEEQDTGLYHCIVVNEVMQKRMESPRINLIVRKPTHPPELVYYPEADKIGLEGEQLSLKCLAVGHPVPQIWWEREDAELPHNRSSHTSFGQELIISSLKIEDAGIYRCIADNGEGERTEALVTLMIKAAPSWENEPVSVTIPVGSPASFTCTARGDPTPEITWLINNQPALEVSQALKLDIVEGTGHGTLTVNQTMDVDSSSAIQCVASNRYGSIISNAHLTVLALAPVLQVSAPAVMVVLEGETVRLPCRGFGAPSPFVTWWSNSGDKLVNEDGLQILADGSLVLCDISVTDERDYKCVLENKFGYQTSKTQLFIRSRTRLINPPSDTQIMAGDELVLPCRVTSDPTHHITFTWMTPRGLEVSVGSGGDGSFRIESVSEEDEGLYTCNATSDLDGVSASASVVVEEREIPAQCGNNIVDDGEECDQGSYNASSPHPCCTKYCQWRSDVPCRKDTHCCKDCQLVESGIPCKLDHEYPECYLLSYCNGLDPHCPHQNYVPNGASCRNNGICFDGICIPFCQSQLLETCDCTSEADACIHCCVKDGICAPFLSQVDNSTIPLDDQVTCAGNGLCSQGECLSHDSSPRPITTPIHVSTTIPTTIETATPSISQLTTSMSATTLAILGDELPNPPLEVTMTSLSSPLDVQLSWSWSGDDDDDHITQFNVESQTAYSRGGWKLLASVPSNQTQARVNLAPYMTYRFRVKAVNTVGESEPAETSGQYFTPPAKPISNPENVSFTVENGQVVVNWKANSPEEHGAPFFTYRVRWGPLDTQTWQEAIVQMTQHTFTIPDSHEDGHYQVSVRSANAVGLGPEPEIFTYGSVTTTQGPVSTISPYLGFVLRPPEEIQVLVGSRLTLPCQGQGSPHLYTEWFFNSRRVVMSNQVEVHVNGELVIDPADLSNTGVYLCRISNQQSVQTATSDVAVVAPMLMFTATPPATVDVLIGESILLPCQAGGFPQATLIWRFGKEEIDYGADIYMAENNSIIIPVADESHSGLYQCIISNGLHNVKIADSQVNVREQLQVSIEPVGILTIIGSEITLPCRVIHDHPLVRVYWTRNGAVIYENYINQTLQDFALVIESVTWDDWGHYKCFAETALDSKSDSVDVVIQTLPEAPYNIKINNTPDDLSEVGVTFDNPFDGNSPISSYIIEYSSPAAEVPWQVLKTIAPGNSSQVMTRVTIPPYYGYYIRAKAVNEFGMSGASQISDPIYIRPTEPTRNPLGVMTQVLDGGSQINVTWEPLSKSELNGPGFYYIIDLRGANQRYGSMVTIDDFRQSGIILDVDPSLMPYELMIQAGNNIGLGPMPEIVTAGIEEMGLAVPDAPTNVMIDMITPTSINVTWTPVPQRPTYGNVYGYKVIVEATTETVFGARPERCLSTTSNCEIAGLHPGTTYQVTVIANGDGGEGFSSMPITVTVSADLPSAVRRLKVRTWARTMLIKWEKPESGDVQGYVIIYQRSSGEAHEETMDSGKETSLKLGGLTPGSNYHVTVIAFNEAGRGEPTSINISTKPSKSKRSHQ